LIDIKEKHNKDLIWTISVKILSKKEVAEFKKDCVTIPAITKSDYENNR